ncbi:MAG: hypothetical protein H8E57_06695 [Candidatus Cloacimonetes bacterium]|nr:hypothetical protein [Candidatus Cloacimonadota bacterium]
MKKKRDKQKSNPLITGLINMFFDIMKHFIKDFENVRKIKKIDNIGEKFSNLEHLLVRMEDKIQDNRRQIEELKNRLLWGNIITLVLLLIIIFQILK